VTGQKRVFVFLAALLLAVFFTVYACSEEPAETGAGIVAKVTTKKGPLKMRARASARGRVISSVPNGTCLLVLEEDENWCLCRWDGKTGYCGTAYLTMLREADPGILKYRVLRKGDKGEDVLALKQRLQELGFIRSGSTLTGNYNDVLAERVTLFQRQAGMTEDGVASQELQAYAFSDRAPKCSQDLPAVRSPVKQEGNGLKREMCGCCMGEGCECCGYKGWILY
jgi:hypothetical protein